MINAKDITFVLPIHEINDNNRDLIKRALISVKEINGAQDSELMMVGPLSLYEEFKTIVETVDMPQTIVIVDNDGDTSFASQVNLAASKVQTEFFSVLELDDFYNEFVLDVLKRYEVTTYYSDVDVYLTLQELYNDKLSTVTSFANEMAWSASFANNLGEIDADMLDSYYDFNVTGGFIRTKKFIENGGLKKSLKMAAWYEYLLRTSYHKGGILVIPKVGYVHTVGREGSYMVECHENVSAGEGKWLIDMAKQEYFFNEDRNKVYEEGMEETSSDMDSIEMGENEIS